MYTFALRSFHFHNTDSGILTSFAEFVSISRAKKTCQNFAKPTLCSSLTHVVWVAKTTFAGRWDALFVSLRYTYFYYYLFAHIYPSKGSGWLNAFLRLVVRRARHKTRESTAFSSTATSTADVHTHCAITQSVVGSAVGTRGSACGITKIRRHLRCTSLTTQCTERIQHG